MATSLVADDGVCRYITVRSIFGLMQIAVQARNVWNYDGSHRETEWLSLDSVPSENVEPGDRLAVNEGNVVPLVRVNWSQIGERRSE